MKSLFNLQGKIACVTGARIGLGLRAAQALCGAGAKVVGVARNMDKLEASELLPSDSFRGISHDLSERKNLFKLAQKVNETFGEPDIIVHCAGVNTREPIDEITDDGWDQTIELNLATPFFLSREFVPAMKKKSWGRIVNFASLQSFRAFTDGLSYGASKGGVAQMTRAMAEGWSRFGINVNAIGPGFFKTELTAKVFADLERAKRNASQTCIGRNGEPSDMDGPLLFFCSEASKYVTGQVLMVDGGFTAK